MRIAPDFALRTSNVEGAIDRRLDRPTLRRRSLQSTRAQIVSRNLSAILLRPASNQISHSDVQRKGPCLSEVVRESCGEMVEYSRGHTLLSSKPDVDSWLSCWPIEELAPSTGTGLNSDGSYPSIVLTPPQSLIFVSWYRVRHSASVTTQHCQSFHFFPPSHRHRAPDQP